MQHLVLLAQAEVSCTLDEKMPVAYSLESPRVEQIKPRQGHQTQSSMGLAVVNAACRSG